MERQAGGSLSAPAVGTAYRCPVCSAPLESDARFCFECRWLTDGAERPLPAPAAPPTHVPAPPPPVELPERAPEPTVLAPATPRRSFIRRTARRAAVLVLFTAALLAAVFLSGCWPFSEYPGPDDDFGPAEF